MAEAKIAKAEEALSKDKKKEKKRKRKEQSVTRDLESDDEETNEGDKEARREARKKDRESRKKDKDDLKEKVPKVDEDGIAYTKIQTKRMIKRVKRGLPPVPTKHEENERLRNEAQLRREEEAELSGMIFGKEEDDEEEEEQAVKDDKDEDDDSEGAENDKADSDEEEKEESKFKKAQKENPAIQKNKKAKRSKTVPDDYVCSACKNKHQPIHWIYDCPNKITIRGTNQKKKKLRGLHDPDSKKVFVSGLPFEVKPDDVEQLFKGCGTVASCKLIKFEDTGRCKGQAYVSFDTDDGAKKAMKLSGTTIDNSKDEPKKKAKKSDTPAKARLQLKLKVTKVMNRWMTHKK